MRKKLLIGFVVFFFIVSVILIIFLVSQNNNSYSSDHTVSKETLRSSYRTLSNSDKNMMLKKYSFFDNYENKNGNFKNDFSIKTINGDKVVVDKVTNLMWHQGGSLSSKAFTEAKKWIVSLNSRGYAGYNDWRLPTLEEATSLLDKNERNRLFIDPVFSSKQQWIWTGDGYNSKEGWVVYFYSGFVHRDRLSTHIYVRPVRIDN